MNNHVHICQRQLSFNRDSLFDSQHQIKPDNYTWQKIVTFGVEGTEAGNFCRPWGVAVMRCPDSLTFKDYWMVDDNERINATDAISQLTAAKLGFLNDDWNLDLGSNIDAFSNQTNQFINNNNSTSLASQTYLIGIADRSNNRIQLFKFDAKRQTVSFVLMFGDGPGARQGQFDRPAGLVFNEKQEQIIVTDKDNHRVQVFSLCGDYLFKFGERGTKVGQFLYPWDIDLCKITRNIVVSDTRNRRVQIFNESGQYVTHFSQPIDSPRGVSFIAPNDIMVSDFNKHRLLMITYGAEKIVSSTNIGSGLDYLNQQINGLSNISRAVSRQNSCPSFESKYVGFGEGSSWGEFLRPQGVAADRTTVFCADSRNNRVACYDKETQSYCYIGRDVVELDRPAGIASIDDYIVIVDFGNNRVHICQRQLSFNRDSLFDYQHKIKPDSYTWQKIVTFGVEGTEAGNFCRPWGVAVMRCPDSLTFKDYWMVDDNERINATDAISQLTAAKLGFLNDDWNLDLGSNIDAFSNQTNQFINNNNSTSLASQTYLIGIADRSNNRIQLFKFDAKRQTVSFVLMFGDGPGARQGQFDRPAGLVFNEKQEQIIVTDKDNHRVQVFSLCGDYLFKFGERGTKVGQFFYPWDIDLCKITRNIVVSDTRNRRVQIFNESGQYITHFSQPIDSPRGVSFITPNEIIVSDFNKHRLLLISVCNADKVVTSSSLTSVDDGSNQFNGHSNNSRSTSRQSSSPSFESKYVGFGEGSSWGEFLRPQGVATDGKTVYCADSRNNRVACWNKISQKFSYIGRDVLDLDRPAGIACIDDYIVIVDFGNNRVHICQHPDKSVTCINGN